MLRRVFALVLALVMVLAFSATALADGTTLDANGEQGAFTEKDTPESQGKVLILNKELMAYNVSEDEVNAPTISYVYTIAAATVEEGTTVTDNSNKHNSDASVTAPVFAGENASDIVVDTVSWIPENKLNTDTDGEVNYKDITVDFSNVAFSKPGIYRYKITESLAEGFTYANTGVTETTGSHERYIDVYVRAADGYDATDGITANDWDIYGFTCFYNNAKTITDANKATSAVKTTGFVAGSTDGTDDTAFTADSYYTFNLTISKTVVGDAYAAANTEFPFTVVFTNGTITKNIDIIGDPDDPAVGTVNSASRVVKLKDGDEATYVGIPCGTSVEVYETNTATGVTYKVTTELTASNTPTTTTDDSVIAGSEPDEAAPQDEKQAYQSTKATFTTTANADTDIEYAVAITNTFVAISPTGVILRYAPYMLILAGGILLLVLGTKLLRRSRREEE